MIGNGFKRTLRIGHYRELAALGQLVLVAPEGEGLRDVCPRPGELHPQLVNRVRVLRRGLGREHLHQSEASMRSRDPRQPITAHPGRGVAAALQREDVAAVAQDHLASSQPLQDGLAKQLYSDI